MIAIETVSVRYCGIDDRILLRCTGTLQRQSTFDFQLTRRFVSRLLPDLAELLAKTSALATRVPLDLRDEVILMEHQAAVSAPTTKSTHGFKNPERLRSHLLVRLDVTTIADGYILTWFVSDTDPVATLTCTRHGMHQVLAAIDGAARLANWGLPVVAAWIDPRGTSLPLI